MEEKRDKAKTATAPAAKKPVGAPSGKKNKKTQKKSASFAGVLLLLIFMVAALGTVAYLYNLFGFKDMVTVFFIGEDSRFEEAMGRVETQQKNLTAREAQIKTIEDELNLRKQELDVREEKLNRQAEGVLNEQDELEKQVLAFDERKMDFSKLVEVVLKMKPAEAAAMLNDLTVVQTARILAELDSKTAAKILQEMDNERAAAVARYVVQYAN